MAVFCYYSFMLGVVGIDEVGRGCWAGPLLVVAARLKPRHLLPAGLKDSKLLTPSQREIFAEQIVEKCELGEGWVQHDEIDKLGLARAMKLGVARALMGIGVAPDDAVIIDGLVNYCPPEFTNVSTIAKADSLHPIVSAASIYAKVKRDQHMSRIAPLYPHFQFEKHVGYGTKLHMEMLKLHGVSQIHRQSFKPIQALL